MEDFNRCLFYISEKDTKNSFIHEKSFKSHKNEQEHKTIYGWETSRDSPLTNQVAQKK